MHTPQLDDLPGAFPRESPTPGEELAAQHHAQTTKSFASFQTPVVGLDEVLHSNVSQPPTDAAETQDGEAVLGQGACTRGEGMGRADKQLPKQTEPMVRQPLLQDDHDTPAFTAHNGIFGHGSKEHEDMSRRRRDMDSNSPDSSHAQARKERIHVTEPVPVMSIGAGVYNGVAGRGSDRFDGQHARQPGQSATTMTTTDTAHTSTPPEVPPRSPQRNLTSQPAAASMDDESGEPARPSKQRVFPLQSHEGSRHLRGVGKDAGERNVGDVTVTQGLQDGHDLRTAGGGLGGGVGFVHHGV